MSSEFKIDIIPNIRRRKKSRKNFSNSISIKDKINSFRNRNLHYYSIDQKKDVIR